MSPPVSQASQTPNNSMAQVTQLEITEDVNITNENIDNNNDSGYKTKSPVAVKDKFQKMRRSITEPLIQYFHDITLNSEQEEPDILNTPKSLIQVPEAGKKLSRKLFNSKEQQKAKETETLQRHAARTSQVNEYQNISPTPSTDL